MTYPKISRDRESNRIDSSDGIAALRAENAALKAEIAAMLSANDATALAAARDQAIREAVSQASLQQEREITQFIDRLNELIHAFCEVRYTLNADWTELAQLSSDGFIPDTVKGDPDWLNAYIPAEHRDLVRAEIKRAIAAKDTYTVEHKVNQVDGSVGWALSRAVPLFNAEGEITSWMGAASDITHRKTAEQAQRMLNDELAHRMKNTFAMVQAIASQTLRQSENLDEGRKAVSARIHALARAQDTLTGANLTAAEIKTIVGNALAPHRYAKHRISTSGPNISLPPQRALGLALAIHELATNATKYGALSNETGTVSVTWDLVDGVFTFTWVEAGGPQVEHPTRRSFGSTLIEQIVGPYFDGRGTITFDPAGVQFHMIGTAKSYEAAPSQDTDPAQKSSLSRSA
ncbi:sensor histidine kinase [Loktanella agnita]|uniref:sensor histidine kinase n=1 Tax=Loktanella agnita TaxID=287097 RepID=UPI003988BADC